MSAIGHCRTSMTIPYPPFAGEHIVIIEGTPALAIHQICCDPISQELSF
jgi:hypothetical protein